MLKIKCQVCNTELIGSSKFQSCGCSNMTSIHEETVTASDLSKVIVIHNDVSEDRGLSSSDLVFQEKRRKRKVRKMYFEER